MYRLSSDLKELVLKLGKNGVKCEMPKEQGFEKKLGQIGFC